MAKPRTILLLALRRSGTTLLFNLFSQNPQYTCFDEPFNKQLADLPRDHRKQVRRDFIRVYNKDPGEFRKLFAPVPRQEELSGQLSVPQKAYLRYLCAHEPAFFDITRCHGKLADLKDIAPDAVLVHLYRNPRAFVTSHLLPSEPAALQALKLWLYRKTFFTRSWGFNTWGMSELLQHPHRSVAEEFHQRANVRLPPAGSAAASLLLAHWLGCFRRMESEGRLLFQDRFISVCFDTFCQTPAAVLKHIYERANAPMPAHDFSIIRRPASPYRGGSPQWRTLARGVGYSDAELARFFDEAPGHG